MQKEEVEEDIKSWEDAAAAAAFLTLLFQVQCCRGKEKGGLLLSPQFCSPYVQKMQGGKVGKEKEIRETVGFTALPPSGSIPLSGLAALLIPFSLSVGCDPEKKSLMSSLPILFPFCVTDSHTTSSPILSSSYSGPLSNLPPSEDDAKTRRRHSYPTERANFH